ncbi:hypothetical protein BT69DRAFT_1265366 [Atractiella rhizophila]|nr:hypothetical protein BT69DRAFT_1265366 [Atractiella rhizophila]
MHRAVLKLQSSSSPKVQFLCLSNANSVFIDVILRHHKLDGLFERIITNPADFEGDLLNVHRRVDPKGVQHECRVGCSANMCKGEELTRYLEEYGGVDRWSKILYVGDGANDYCPVLRLRPQDSVICRKYRGLEKAIATGPQRGYELKCKKRDWAAAWEAEREMLNEVLAIKL